MKTFDTIRFNAKAITALPGTQGFLAFIPALLLFAAMLMGDYPAALALQFAAVVLPFLLPILSRDSGFSVWHDLNLNRPPTLNRVIPWAAVALIVVVLLQIGTAALFSALGFEPGKQMQVTMLAEADGGTRLILLLTILIIAPVSEELIFRHFFFGGLASKLGWQNSIPFTALAFAAIHCDIQFIPGLFALGVALQLIYLTTGKLWNAIATHMLFNAVNVAIVLGMP